MIWLLTILGPQLLAATRMALELPEDMPRKRKYAFTLLLMISAPFLMFYHKLSFYYFDQLLKTNPKNSETIKVWEHTKRILHNHVKLELGLETIYQMTIQLILLALANSQTSTNEAFNAYFRKDKSYKIGMLWVSILYSFLSCVVSHLTAMTACRERLPFKTAMIVSLYSFMGITTRILAMVMYFVPALGLFNLLRHLQAEQIPWNANLVYGFSGSNSNDTISFGNELLSLKWNLLDRCIIFHFMHSCFDIVVCYY